MNIVYYTCWPFLYSLIMKFLHLLQAVYPQLGCREDLWFPQHLERFAPL